MTSPRCFREAVRLGLLGALLVSSALVHAQATATVIDSVPRKLYTELYSDKGGNQFLVEVYEESQEGQSQLHFRAFKNGSLVVTKSQAVAESHNFTFFVDELQDRLMPQQTEDLLIKVFSRLFQESDERMRQAMLEVFNEEKVAQYINENLQVPPGEVDEEELAKLLSPNIKPVVDDEALAARLSSQVKPVVDEEALAKRLSGQVKPVVNLDDSELAKRLSEQVKPVVDDAALAKRLANDPQLAEQLSKNVKPVVNEAALAARLSGQVKPVVDDEALAARLSSQVKPVVDDAALAARLSSQVKPVVDDEALAERLSSKVKPRLDEEKLAKRLSQRVKPQINEKRLADRLSRNIKPSPVDLNEEALAVALAIKLTEQEKLASLKVRKYPELLSQVEEANRAGDYEKTLQLLDEDLANRTPEEQRKALKISGIMSVLVGAKKMKRALSTIDDYDLPDDPELRQLQQSLDNWLQENLVME